VTVGSQVLLGLPYLERLRRRLGQHVAVWPQETGFCPVPWETSAGAIVVLAEVWPTAFLPQLAPTSVKDEQQVSWAVRTCARRQRIDGLAGWFEPPSVRGMGRQHAVELSAEEGWILGIP
jgi:hypothetical protein